MNKSPLQAKNSKIKLVVGLGNPGSEYKNTYHNAGILFVDYLKNLPIFNFSANGGSASGGQFSIFKLLKSDVYMNESGGFVKKVLKKYGAKPEEILIAHDDSDLAIGGFKLSFDRGSAGHNGIESIIKTLGTKKFWRLRIGIRPQSQTSADYTQNNAENSPRKSASGLRRSAAQRAKAGEFVLKTISKNNKEILLKTFEEITDTIILPEKS